MTVIRWNAFREFDDLLARAPLRPVAAAGAVRKQRFTPLADISETEAGYLIELELPGLAAEDVRVSVHDGVLEVAGERVPTYRATQPAKLLEADEHADTAAESPSDEANSESAQPQLHRVERHFGTFERRFRLPKDADAASVKAAAKNGVLAVTIGRRAEAARRAIEVQVA